MAQLAHCFCLVALSVLKDNRAQILQIAQAEADLRIGQRLRTDIVILFELPQLVDDAVEQGLDGLRVVQLGHEVLGQVLEILLNVEQSRRDSQGLPALHQEIPLVLTDLNGALFTFWLLFLGFVCFTWIDPIIRKLTADFNLRRVALDWDVLSHVVDFYQRELAQAVLKSQVCLCFDCSHLDFFLDGLLEACWVQFRLTGGFLFAFSAFHQHIHGFFNRWTIERVKIFA